MMGRTWLATLQEPVKIKEREFNPQSCGGLFIEPSCNFRHWSNILYFFFKTKSYVILE